MRIGCLQFAPQVGDVDNNLNRADSVLDRADPEDLDLLVLPELAFTGYNFKSLRDISPYLEHLNSGVSSLWARTTALKHDCTIIAGYAETVDVSDRWPANPEYYNSALVVNSDGDTIANYRKSHLYYTDETWALEGPSGFYAGRIPGLGRTAIGICMDINPYKFEAPWDDFEFAHHALDSGAHLIVISMAWLTQEDQREYLQTPREPDMHTLMYWVSRLEPIIRRESSHEVIVVFANRSGTEDNVTYAGTSAVVGIKEGEVLIYGLLGRGDKELLVVDTDEPPFAKLVHTHNSSNVAVPNDEPERQVAKGHETTSSNVSKTSDRSNTEQSHPNVREQRDEPASNAQYHGSWGHESLGLGASDSRRESDYPRFDSSDQPKASAQSSQDLSSARDADHLGQFLDEHPSRTSSSNGYLNSHTGHLHDTRSSHGRTPDSLQPRQGSVTDSSRPSTQAPVSTRKPTWGQLPQRRGDEDGYDWGRSDDEDNGSHDDMDEPWHSDQDESPWTRNNRHSIRSDVSVWNNFSGRSQKEEVYHTPQSKMVSKKIEDYLRGSTPISERQQNLGRFTEHTPAKRPESSSRQQSASRAHEREDHGSAVKSHKHASKLSQSHIASGSRTGSARGSDKNPTKMKRAETFSPETHETRTRPEPSASARIHSGAGMRQKTLHRAASIPIAMNRDAVAEARETSLGPRGAHVPPAASEERPILRPASRNRLRERSDSTRGRTADAAHSHAAANNDSVSSSAAGHKESRQLSRGRQRMTRSSLDYQPPPSSSRVSHSAQARRATPAEQADLSQFHLIEDLPSENCPVHGARSRSGAGHRTGSRRRTSSSRHGRHGSRDIRDSRRTTHDTPTQQRGQVPPTSSTPSKAPSSAPASRLTKSNLKKASQPGRKMTQSVQLGFKDARHNGEGDRVVATEVTRLDMKHGPKTPVAMVLVGDAQEEDGISQDIGAATPFTSFGVRGSNIGLTRPRSAIL